MVISTKKIGLSPRQDFEEIAFFQVFIDRSSSLRIDASDPGGGGPDLMMFLVPIAKDATCTMTVEYSPSTIDLEKKSKINLSTWPPLR